MSSRPLIYLVAGEPSGDLLGARLMEALRTITGGNIAFAGIGGETMKTAGLVTLFPQADLAVMGLTEVLPRIPKILGRLKQTIADIEARKPAAIVTIDSWGFTGRLLKRLGQSRWSGPRIHFVAPMVWAWRSRRARQLVGRVDLLLCLLPNEPEWFEREGVRAIHIGHPVIETGADKGDGVAFRARRQIPADAPLIAVLPGSRHSETSRLLPVFAETLARVAQTHPGLRVVVPTVETVADQVGRAIAAWPVPALLVRGAEERYAAFAASQAALAASGTVTLELALARVPMVVGYRLAPLTAFMARRLMKLTYFSLPNLIGGGEIVPEYLLDRCNPDLTAPALACLLDDEAARATQLDGFAKVAERLGVQGEMPSVRAAREVLRLIEENRR